MPKFIHVKVTLTDENGKKYKYHGDFQNMEVQHSEPLSFDVYRPTVSYGMIDRMTVELILDRPFRYPVSGGRDLGVQE